MAVKTKPATDIISTTTVDHAQCQHKSPWLSLLIAVLIGQLIVGCAWIDPHPRAPELYDFKFESSSIKFAGNLPNAIDAAIAQRKLYASYGSQMSVFRSATAITVGAVTVPALYLGMHGEKPDAVTALGLAGASALGLASYFDSRPRQRLYYAASRTVGCAIAAMTPFLIPEGEFKNFTDALTSLGNETANVETAASNVENAVSVLSSTEQVVREYLAFAKTQASTARLLLERSNLILREGNRLKSLIDRSGPTLRTNVIDIVDKVDDEIIKTESDPQSLITLLSGLQTVVKQITRVTPTGGGTATSAAPDPKKGGVQSFAGDPTRLFTVLIDSLARLQNSTATMTRQTIPVAALINQVAAAKEQVQDIKSCQPPEAKTDFAVFPDDDTKEVQAPATFTYLVTGNVNAPRAYLTNQSTADATVDIKVKGGFHEVEIVIGKNAKTIDAVLLIQNGNDLGRKSITLRIKEAPKATTDAAAKAAATTLRASEHKLSQEDVKTLQFVVGLRRTDDPTIKDRTDGIIGVITRDAVRKYKEDNGLGTDSTIDSTFWQSVVAKAREALPNPASTSDLKPTPNVYETQQLPSASQSKDPVKIEALKDIQRRLSGFGAKETGEYDADMRKAIIAFQASQNRRATGNLGQLLVAAIKNTSTKNAGAVGPATAPKSEASKSIDPEADEKAASADDRKAAQRTLAADFKLTIKDDGNFGEDTRKAIKAYQAKEKHLVTGFLTRDEIIDLVKREPKK